MPVLWKTKKVSFRYRIHDIITTIIFVSMRMWLHQKLNKLLPMFNPLLARFLFPGKFRIRIQCFRCCAHTEIHRFFFFSVCASICSVSVFKKNPTEFISLRFFLHSPIFFSCHSVAHFFLLGNSFTQKQYREYERIVHITLAIFNVISNAFYQTKRKSVFGSLDAQQRFTSLSIFTCFLHSILFFSLQSFLLLYIWLFQRKYIKTDSLYLLQIPSYLFIIETGMIKKEREGIKKDYKIVRQWNG